MPSSTRPSPKTCFAKPACLKTLALAKQHVRNTVMSKLTGSACSAVLRPDTIALELTICASTATIMSGTWAKRRLSKTAMASIVRSVSHILHRRETLDKVAASHSVAESADPKNLHFWKTRKFNRLSLQITCLRLTSMMSANR